MIPRKLTEKIANRTVENIKTYGRQRGWTSTEFVTAWARRDKFGVKLDGVQWLIFQNFGTKPHIPWSLEGKTVPMEFGFRKAIGVGMPGYVNIEGVKTWRDEKWRNPGIEANNFIQVAASKAIRLYLKQIQAYEPKFRVSLERE